MRKIRPRGESISVPSSENVGQFARQNPQCTHWLSAPRRDTAVQPGAAGLGGGSGRRVVTPGVRLGRQIPPTKRPGVEDALGVELGLDPLHDAPGRARSVPHRAASRTPSGAHSRRRRAPPRAASRPPRARRRWPTRAAPPLGESEGASRAHGQPARPPRARTAPPAQSRRWSPNTPPGRASAARVATATGFAARRASRAVDSARAVPGRRERGRPPPRGLSRRAPPRHAPTDHRAQAPSNATNKGRGCGRPTAPAAHASAARGSSSSSAIGPSSEPARAAAARPPRP